MSKENQTPSQPKRLFLELALWANDLKDLQTFNDSEDILELVYETFLASSFADDNQDRNEAMVIFAQLKKLFSILNNFTDDDFRQYLQLTNKFKEPCITETK